MTAVTPIFYKPTVIVWRDKHFDRKLLVTETLEMAKFGPVTGVWGVVMFSMVDSISQLKDSNRQAAMETSKVPWRSVFGVIGIMVMDPWWWLVGEEDTVSVLITELGSQKLTKHPLSTDPVNMTSVKMKLLLDLIRWICGSVKWIFYNSFVLLFWSFGLSC